MNITTFVENYKAKKFITVKQGVNGKSEWIRSQLEIKDYIPFKKKREIAEMIVFKNISEVDGIKKYDSINGYIGLIVASIMAHTNLEWSADPIADYDLLAESGLLMDIISEFEGSHAEIDLLLHMTLDMAMEDNELNAIVGRFLNKISGTLDEIIDVVKDKFGDFDLKSILGEDIKPEDLAKLTGLLDKLK